MSGRAGWAFGVRSNPSAVPLDFSANPRVGPAAASAWARVLPVDRYSRVSELLLWLSRPIVGGLADNGRLPMPGE